MDDIIVGLDIGTSKVCAVVGEIQDEDEGINIVGIGCRPSYGFEKGVVVDFERLVDAIQGAIEDAEMMCGYKIEYVYVGIAGTHIAGQNSKGLITISNKGRSAREISEEDIMRVIESAQYLNLPTDREIIHVLPWEFVVDGQHGVKDPLGMTAVRVEAEVHIITGSKKSSENIVKCINKAGYHVIGLVLEPLASAETIFNEEERELGSILIDIGGGITNCIVFVGGNVRYTFNLPIGGRNVTHDISYLLRTSESVAEDIKIKHGSALCELVYENENIEVPTIGGREPKRIPRSSLCEIIECRMDELFRIVKQKLDDTDFMEKVAGGLVLSGGGCLLEGTSELAEKIFNMPVRIGFPRNLGSLEDQLTSPIYTTSVGLVQYALREIDNEEFEEETENVMDRMKDKFKKIWGEIFT